MPSRSAKKVNPEVYGNGGGGIEVKALAHGQLEHRTWQNRRQPDPADGGNISQGMETARVVFQSSVVAEKASLPPQRPMDQGQKNSRARDQRQNERASGGMAACIPRLRTKFPDQSRVLRTRSRQGMEDAHPNVLPGRWWATVGAIGWKMRHQQEGLRQLAHSLSDHPQNKRFRRPPPTCPTTTLP